MTTSRCAFFFSKSQCFPCPVYSAQFLDSMNESTTLAKKIETTARMWHRRVICRACTRLCLACVPVSIFLARVVGRAVEHNRQSGFNFCYCLFHGLKVQCLIIGLSVYETGSNQKLKSLCLLCSIFSCNIT